MDEADQVIEEFLENSPRATEWRAMRQALADRLEAARRQRQAERAGSVDPARLTALDTQITALEKQVRALETEEAITQFVEDSIRVSLAKAAPDRDEDV